MASLRSGQARGGRELQREAAALSRLVLAWLGVGGHAGLVAQPFLPSTTPTHSDISSLPCFCKKNLMFSIIHPSQKIIDRARNENPSHILRSAASRKGHISRSGLGAPYPSCPLPGDRFPSPSCPSLPPGALPSTVPGGRGPPGDRRGWGHHPGSTPAPQHAPHLPQSGGGWPPTIPRSSWSCPLAWDPAPRPWSLPIFHLGPSGSLEPLPGARPSQASHHGLHPPTRNTPCRLLVGVLTGVGGAQQRVGHCCSFFAALSIPPSS